MTNTDTQPLTNFAKGHAQQVELFRRANAAADIVAYGPMPDYKTNPDGWTGRMRARMATSPAMKRAGLGVKDMNCRIIMDDTLAHLEQRGQMGDEAAAFKELHKLCRAHVARRRKSRREAAEMLREKAAIDEYGESIGLLRSEIASATIKIPRGQEYVSRCKMELDHYLALHPRPTEDGAPPPKLFDRMFDKPKETSELDSWFPRDKDGKPVDDPKTDELMQSLGKLVDETPDELTVWSAVSAPKDSQQFAAFNHFKRELAVIDSTADAGEHILKALDSVPLGVYIAEHGIQAACDKLQSHLDNLPNSIVSKTALKTPEISLPAIGVQEMQNEAPSAQNSSVSQPASTALPEAPFSANFKLIHKSGVEIQFTIRAASGAEGMPQIDKAIDYLLTNGYTTRQQAQAAPLPSNATPITSAPTLPPPATAAPSGEADSAGRRPGQTGSTVITGVKVVKDEGKTIIELWAGGQYAEHRLQQPTEHGFVERLTDWSALEVGTKYPVNWTSDWTVSSKRAQKGKQNYYLNVTGIRDNAAAQRIA